MGGLTVERVALLKQEWGDYQRRRRLKTTNQRELIVDEFLRSAGHVSIEDLFSRVRTKAERVGYATVYRTIKLLTDAKLAAPRQFNDGQTRYEVAGQDSPHHDHLICMQCDLILEFENDEIERLQESVAKDLGGFKVMQHKMELYALCPKAQGIPAGRCLQDEQAAGAPLRARAASPSSDDGPRIGPGKLVRAKPPARRD